MSRIEELTLESALQDPLIGLVRAADHVDPGSFETLLRGVACRLAEPLLDNARPQRCRRGGAVDFAFAIRPDKGGSSVKPSLQPRPAAPDRSGCGCRAAW